MVEQLDLMVLKMFFNLNDSMICVILFLLMMVSWFYSVLFLLQEKQESGHCFLYGEFYTVTFLQYFYVFDTFLM